MEKIAEQIANEVIKKGKPKKIKVRTLIKKFNFLKRTEDSARKITQILSDYGIYLNPPIMKIDDNWKLSLDDRVSLTYKMNHLESSSSSRVNKDFNKDKWFDKIRNKNFRNEREVETKFIIPLLSRLGYSEDDRYDGMRFTAYNGSRPIILETDFSLFDNDNKQLANQVLLVVEAKHETRLKKEVELINAQKQTKSYAVWLSCHHGVVTDGKKIQVLNLLTTGIQQGIGKIDILFECKIDELKEKFEELFNLISKQRLVEYYENIIK